MKKLALVFCVASLLQAGEPSHIEYAFRWNPEEAGPRSAQEFFSLLGEPYKEKSEYTVRYLDVHVQGYPDAILRERKESKANTEYVLKFRSPKPFTTLPPCPQGMEGSYEIDQSLLSKDSSTRVYSYSCKGNDPLVLTSLKAKAPSCASHMVRYEGKKLRLEEWSLPQGKKILELSRKEKYPKESGKKFQEALHLLWRNGAKGYTSSKTEAASRCP